MDEATTIVPEEEKTTIRTETRKKEEKKDPMWWTVLTWIGWVIKWIFIIMVFGTMAVFFIPSS